MDWSGDELACLLESAVEAAGVSEDASVAEPESNVFRRCGDVWQIEFGQASFQLRHLKGLDYIAQLIAARGRSLDVLVLCAEPEMVRSGAEVVDESGLAVSEGRDLDAHGRDSIMDRQAMRDAAAELERVDEQIATAEAAGDGARVAELRDEEEQLRAQIDSAQGLFGRVRSFPDSRTRKRTAVKNAIDRALKKIVEHSPELYGHFRNSIDTGLECRYQPERLVEWEL